MPIRTGIDIVDIRRFDDLLEKYGNNLTEDFFTEPERTHARSKKRPGEWFATYWALREAAYKIGNGSLWNHYSVDPEDGTCQLIVSDELFSSDDCQIPEGTQWDSSVTRTDHEVVATVLASWSLSFTSPQ